MFKHYYSILCLVNLRIYAAISYLTLLERF